MYNFQTFQRSDFLSEKGVGPSHNNSMTLINQRQRPSTSYLSKEDDEKESWKQFPLIRAQTSHNTTRKSLLSEHSPSSNHKVPWMHKTFKPAPKLIDPEPYTIEEITVPSVFEISVMNFTSWFTVTSALPSAVNSTFTQPTVQYIHISYHLATETFVIRMGHRTNDKGRRQSITEHGVRELKHVRSENGQTELTCFDLFIGQKLKIDNRTITLKQCDLQTRLWLESSAKRLLQIKQLLLNKLNKYQPTNELKHRLTLLSHKSSACSSKANEPQNYTQIHLRSLMKQVVELKTQLARYRPDLSEKVNL